LPSEKGSQPFPVSSTAKRQLHERHALPAPQGPRRLPKEVRQAITRNAHALGLLAFEKTREYVEKYAGDHARQLDVIHALDLDDGQHVLVNQQTLWSLCATLSTLEVLADTVMARLATLEKETGREWYGRGEA
jgi:hypothetical protein